MPTKKQIHVEVHFSPAKLEEMQLKDKNIVVIDVLRASTSVAMALHNGAKEIIPVSNIESAVKIRKFVWRRHSESGRTQWQNDRGF